MLVSKTFYEVARLRASHSASFVTVTPKGGTSMHTHPHFVILVSLVSVGSSAYAQVSHSTLPAAPRIGPS
jgi:hypothetical protein